MAEMLVFCSKTLRTDAFGDIGVEDICLRHPSTHATAGSQTWQIRFPVDIDAIGETRRRQDHRDFYSIKFKTGVLTRSALLRDLSLA